MADLDELRKYQLEFQRVQMTAAKQKLSERNVVEIVKKLVELKLVEVLYTSDGKEYLTPQHLAREIRDELAVQGGRINLVDLQQALNVDLSHIEAKVNELVKQDKNLTLILGQLIDSSYRDKLADEVNDRLHEQGHVTVAELAKFYDLPAEFVRELIEEKIGTAIKGQVDIQDKDIIFTDSFVSRMTARIRGGFSALTVPVPVGSIRSRTGCHERLFHTILEDLIRQGRVKGSLSGGHQDKSTFYPDIYTRSQNQWVDSFYAQNGYLEYDALTRLGIPDVKNFIKKRFKNEKLLFLKSCCIGPTIQDQIEASVEDALSSDSWVDIRHLLPSSLDSSDVSELLNYCTHGRQGALTCSDSIVASQKLIANSAKIFGDLIRQKAEQSVKENPALLKGDGDKTTGSRGSALDENIAHEDKKEQRRKKAAAGSKKEGTGGRETKTKSTKKKGRGRDVGEDSDDEGIPGSGGGSRQPEPIFMARKEIEQVLSSQAELTDCPEDLIMEIASQLFRPLNKQYQEVAKSIFLQASGSGTSADRKKTFGELQEKVSGLWTNARLFEKGVNFFKDANQTNLAKHLLKTLCTDITNILVNALATEHMISISDDTHLSPEARLKLINGMPKDVQAALSKLHQTLNGQNLEEFFNLMENLCSSSHLSIMLKKPDKKKERQLVFAHRQTLSDQLKGETEAAMAMHLAVVLLFQTFTQTMVHAPGRLVPAILQHLKEFLDAEKYQCLTEFQDLVVQRVQAETNGELQKVQDLTEEMEAMLPKIKDIALTTKRSAQTHEEQ